MCWVHGASAPGRGRPSIAYGTPVAEYSGFPCFQLSFNTLRPPFVPPIRQPGYVVSGFLDSVAGGNTREHTRIRAVDKPEKPQRAEPREIVELRQLKEDQPDLAQAIDLQIQLLQMQRRVQSRVPLPPMNL